MTDLRTLHARASYYASRAVSEGDSVTVPAGHAIAVAGALGHLLYLENGTPLTDKERDSAGLPRDVVTT